VYHDTTANTLGQVGSCASTGQWVLSCMAVLGMAGFCVVRRAAHSLPRQLMAGCHVLLLLNSKRVQRLVAGVPALWRTCRAPSCPWKDVHRCSNYGLAVPCLQTLDVCCAHFMCMGLLVVSALPLGKAQHCVK
jgi:hypothetical protein